MREFDDAIAALELVRDAVWSKNKERGFESVTVFLVCFKNVFGHSESFMAEMFPKLESIKDHILAGRFDDANIAVLALLAWLRGVRSKLQANEMIHEPRLDNMTENE
jgi:hypothetical protein